MPRSRSRLIPVLLGLCLPAATAGQPALAPALARPPAALAAVERVELPRLDLEALAVEDARREAAGEPLRFAVPHPVFLTPQAAGSWDELPGDLLRWRLRVVAPGAATLNFGFTRLALPPGGRLLLYAADGSAALGPYGTADARRHGALWTPVLPARDAVIEVTLPAAERPRLDLELTTINQGYRGFGARLGEKSGACNVDIACPEAGPWTRQIRSVARITIAGTFLCSGAMLNNTAQDLRPFFLTADHCGVEASNAASVVVYWNYHNSFCRPPGSGPSAERGDGSLGRNQRGATFRAAYGPSDFALVELDERPNPAWRVYWAGWSRSGGDPSRAVGIHHPQGQEKRISFENDPLSTTSYLGAGSPGNGTHLRVADWDLGTTEGGSSGSPLFDPQGRVVGQLHGGFAACGNDDADWYGRLSASFSGGGSPATRLADWLDPTGSGATVLDGQDQGPTQPSAPPAAPTNLAAVALSPFEVLLTWEDNSGDEAEFIVESAPEGEEFVVAGTLPADTTSTTVSGLLPATTYAFRVRARSLAGTSPYSNVATVTTDPDPPAAPERLQARTQSETSVLLTWTDVADNESAYLVERRTVAVAGGDGAATVTARRTFVGAPFEAVATLPPNSTAHVVAGLEPGATYNFRVRAENDSGASPYSAEAAATTGAGAPLSPPASCAAGPGNLCLLSGRFQVEAFWRNQRNGRTGDAGAVAGSDKSGTFYFFRPSNLELVVKMLDGGGVNGSFWLFYGALSDLEYWIVANDTAGGGVSTYYNPPSNICGRADVTAFPGVAAAATPADRTAGGSAASGPAAGSAGGALREPVGPPALGRRLPAPAAPSAARLRALALPAATGPVAAGRVGSCVPAPDVLCLGDGRFRVEVAWQNQRNGKSGQGTAVRAEGNEQTGFFWFFNPANIELLVKIFDAAAQNGKIWVFYGALTDVEYDLTVTDTLTGNEVSYHNPPGNLCGVGDTAALDAEP